MSGWTICCDFDGTICIPDSSEFLLEKFALPGWKELDDAVWRGEVTEREMFTRQIELLRVTWTEARRALMEGVIIRDGFPRFVKYCREHNVPLTILSSGLRELIDELLTAAGVSGIPVHSHHTKIEGNRWQLVPWEGRRLAEHCSHCKCSFLIEQKEAGHKVIYIGDGYTDLCPIQHADIIFATGRLIDECRAGGRTFFPFETFLEIERKLDELLT
ncbi:MAG: MtnX-like HAD-IB family phosphatase [Calditrichota bacterium]